MSYFTYNFYYIGMKIWIICIHQLVECVYRSWPLANDVWQTSACFGNKDVCW